MDEVRQEAMERAKRSDYFTGARLGEELADFLERRADECRALAELVTPGRPVYLVGSGGSYANAVYAKYAWDRLVDAPVEAVASYELIWRRPRGLGEGAVAVFNSLSGETEDTVAALREAKDRGARTVALVRDAETTLGREADVTVPYDYAFCYEGPVAAMILMATALAANGGEAEEAAAVDRSLLELPPIVADAVARQIVAAESTARQFLHANHLYVVGAGPLSSLAYKVALTVVMENIRIGATWCDSSELRHGPAEAFERISPDMMFLLGTDESRQMTERALEFSRELGASTFAFDAAEYPAVHPLLSGLLLNSLTQCFVVHSALLRGILDLDERVFMGHQVLSSGGAGWP